MPLSSGRILDQTGLGNAFSFQKSGRMTTVGQQMDLRRTFLTNVANNHPQGVPSLQFNLSNPAAQTMKFDKNVLQIYKIPGYLADFKRLAPIATAGLRENYDVKDWNNPNYMYNPVFLSLLIEAEAKFIHEIHQEKSAMLKGMDLSKKAQEIEAALPAETISTVQEIFNGRNTQQILELLRDKPMKVMGKEVRPQTDQMLELEARIMAANDITVVTTEKFTDTTNIYLNSFLCFLLGSDGGTYYTPSHSSVYVLGRKALAGDGAQLLPELYQRFIEHLEGICDQAEQSRYDIRLSEKNNPNIHNTLSYKRVANLFAQAMSPDPATIRSINQAADNGFRITLNTLSGSAAKSLMAQFKAFGINPEIFEPLWAEENPYFEVGYAVVKKGDEYFVDHLGVDTTFPKVVQQIPYAEVLANEKVGKIIYECDPDNDRFVVKQILPESAKELCVKYGIDTYDLGNGKILAAPSPNKTFLLLDIADYERMKSTGQWNNAQYLYFPTYVSSAAWVEFSEWLKANEGNISTFLSRVGFKNFNGVLAQIQNWWFNSTEETLQITPQLGATVILERSKIKELRLLSKEEESGGRASGFPSPVMNILGQQMLSLPEKAVGDALLAHLADMACRFNGSKEMRLPNIIENAFEKYNLVSRIDYRLDILHGDQGVIAQVGPVEAANLKGQAGAQKSNFNNFFFSIAKAIKDKKMTLDTAKEILIKVYPKWKDTWLCADEMLFVEEELTPGVFRPEGVMMSFSAKDGLKPMVTKFKFRPSGTDPLKSKVYIDAEVLGTEQIRNIESVFNDLKTIDLYSVLDSNNIPYSLEKPANIAEIGLRPIIF